METQQWPHKKFACSTALLTSILTILTFGIAILTPPLSGPWCTDSCFTYPFADIAGRFPRDYYWMYAALFQLMAYAVLLACIYDYAPKEKKLHSLLGLCSGLIAAAVLFADYFVQVSVIQPSLIAGETDGIALLTQFNAHGVFIVAEELGYLLMGIACLPLAAVFRGKSYIEKSIRWLLLGCFVLTSLSFIAISFAYGLQREYRFEIASISINWIVLIALGFLLYVFFGRAQFRGQVKN